MKYAINGRDMSKLDKNTMKFGVASESLMELAAGGVYNFIKGKFDNNNKILIFVGCGNNGGDGICLARRLIIKGYKVDVCMCKFSKKTEAFQNQLKILEALCGSKNLKNAENNFAIDEYDIVVDALFGNGLNRELNDYYIEVINKMNSMKAVKIALDISSGLCSETGMSFGNVFKADYSVTFHASKIGMLINDGIENSGKIIIVDIGLIDNIKLNSKINIIDEESYSYVEANILRRKINSHKYTYGVVGIVAMNENMLGASILAAKAAYRSGCGLVKMLLKSNCINTVISSIPEVVCISYEGSSLNNFSNETDVVLIGPGLGKDDIAVDLIKESMLLSKKIVFDASALRIIADHLEEFKNRKCDCVLTPHVGEMAGLLDKNSNYVISNIIECAEKFSYDYEVDLVLKSSKSVIIGKEKHLNLLGNDGLATAGSGDVLSGIVSSLIAQGNEFENSLLIAVIEHALSAEIYAQNKDKRTMISSDIVDNIFMNKYIKY